MNIIIINELITIASHFEKNLMVIVAELFNLLVYILM